MKQVIRTQLQVSIVTVPQVYTKLMIVVSLSFKILLGDIYFTCELILEFYGFINAVLIVILCNQKSKKIYYKLYSAFPAVFRYVCFIVLQLVQGGDRAGQVRAG